MNTNYYNQNGPNYTPKLTSDKIASIVLLIFFIIAEIMILIGGEMETKYKVIFAILILFLASLVGKKVSINTEKKQVETSYFGLIFKENYSFQDFKKFILTKHTTNFINSGTSVSIEFMINGKSKVVEISKLRNAKNAEAFYEETKTIMQK